MRKSVFLICIAITFFILAGCSSKVENPEDVLGDYIEFWASGQYDEMLSMLDKGSIAEIENQDWTFQDRYENVYSDLGIDGITTDFEPLDFKEADIDLSEITEITYPVNITMESAAGQIAYTTDVNLVKEKDSEDNEEWKIVWHPSHLLTGLENPSDRISIRRIQPQRGEIFDRNGNGLALNGEVYRVSIVPDRTDDIEDTAKRLAHVLGLDEDRVLRLAQQYPNNPDWAAPIQNIPLDDPRTSKFSDIPGVQWGKIDGRIYPHGDITGHLIGHIGLINAEELGERQGQGYSATSMIGKNNLELVYEEELRGIPGAVISVTDENGQNSREIASKSPTNGEDIYLSIDIEIQQKLVQTLKNEEAGGVVMDPTSGQVLAMVSEPAFDSNLRYLGLRDPRAESMDDINILFERRFQQLYSPGSIFKPFTAVMGIEENTLDPNEKLNITGRKWQKSSSWGGYHVTRVNEEESQVDLNTAMLRSDNIYFAQQALRLGDSKLEDWAGKFGFGEQVPFEFPMIPSTLSNSGFNSEILIADTGYGQGQIMTSPFHITTMYSIFINEGSMIQPRLISNQQQEFYKEDIASKETIDTVLESLILTVEDKNGTAYRANPGHERKIAGKTGTAELKDSLGQEAAGTIGWYVSFDYERKDLLLTIMIQNAQGRGGSSLAVEAANKFWGLVD